MGHGDKSGGWPSPTIGLSGWKGYGGTFTAAEGKVRASLGRHGMMLMVR